MIRLSALSVKSKAFVSSLVHEVKISTSVELYVFRESMHEECFAQCLMESKLTGITIDGFDDIYTSCHLILLKCWSLILFGCFLRLSWLFLRQAFTMNLILGWS